MSVGRRGFLQAAAGFVGGAVGGTLFSPLPWKLTDDVAIWSQSDKGVPGVEGWQWRVSPERGESSEVASVCLLCGGGCGIRAELVDGRRAVALRGNPDHPVNRGGICPLGAAGLQFFYAPYRYQISQPMKRTGDRGDPSGFQPIGWDEAMGELAGALSSLKGKPESVACVTGQTRSSMTDLWKQFFAAYGSPNFFTMPSHADSLGLAASMMVGHEVPFAFDVENASFVLSIGADLLEGWSSPCRMLSTFSYWSEEKPYTAPTNYIQVEPRCSMTASKAVEWVPIRPGTEAALAFGLAHILIRDEMYDTYFFRNYVFGFDKWVDRDDWRGEEGRLRPGFKDVVMADYAPAKVAEITGIEAEKIEELARHLIRHKNSLVVWGNGDGSVPGNLYHDMAFVALNGLLGNLNPGGLVTLEPRVPLAPLPEVSRKPGRPRLDLAKFKDVRLPGNALYLFLDTLRNEEAPYPVELLLIHEANPAYALPENKFFTDAVQKAGKTISFSSYMDETAAMADVILPNHCAYERLDDVKGVPGAAYGYYAVASPVLKPRLDTRHAGDVLLEAAAKVGGEVKAALPWKNYEAYLQERVKGLAASGKGAVAEGADAEPWSLRPGRPPKKNYKDEKDLWSKLTAGKCWYSEPVHLMESIRTPSERIELVCRSFLKSADFTEWENVLIPLCMRNKEGAIEMVPCEEPPPKPEHPKQPDEIFVPRYVSVKPAGEEANYPLWLVPYRLLYVANGYLPNPPFLNKVLWENLLKSDEQFVELNPATAAGLKVREGSAVQISTPRAEPGVRARVHLSRTVPEGVVFVAEGFGHTAYDEYVRGKGINVNGLTEIHVDPVTGAGTMTAVRAKVSKV